MGDLARVERGWGSSVGVGKSYSNPEALCRWWEQEELDVSFLPTPLAEYALRRGRGNKCLRTLLVGGDQLRYLPEERLPFQVVNNYGPTETTVVATSGKVEGSQRVFTIGRPITNTRVYILNRAGEPAPVGVAGELYVGGVQVARGYLNRPELTAERFVKDPFAEDDGADVQDGRPRRWLADGTIEYLGRNDFQVKIRGFRIELGEIEARLSEHPCSARSGGGGARGYARGQAAGGLLHHVTEH